MIDFQSVSVTYPDTAHPILGDIDLHVNEGELCLVVGRTGSGKSTLLGAMNGHVPHFTGGTLGGRVTVGGRDTRTHRPRDLADVVGVVGQDPLAGFVTDLVEDELAYGMESLGLPANVMRKRVEETLDLLGLAQLRHRPLRTLSGGERQRVAIGSVLTAHPHILVLDEPTSALDPGAADDVLGALHRLVHDLGLTVVVAEHRLERVVQYADRVVRLTGDGGLVAGDPATILSASPVVPPVVELGRLAGWRPLPLSVRDARRMAGPLRESLGLLPPTPRGRPMGAASEVRVELRDVTIRHGSTTALRRVNLTMAAGEVVAVMGRNGAGKSTLLGAMVGLRRPDDGQVIMGGDAPADLSPRHLLKRAGLVPQEAADLLFAETVTRECAAADGDSGAAPGTTAALFESFVPGIDPATHPRDLSEGQRLALVLAVVLAADPSVLLLDEPTRGLDYPTKRRLVEVLRARAASGTAVVVATHDVELVAEAADRVVVLADGEVVADGVTADIVISSPAFAPQTAKILAPQPWLTVADVAAVLPEAG